MDACLLDPCVHKTKLKHIFKYVESQFLSAILSSWLLNSPYWVWVTLIIFQEKDSSHLQIMFGHENTQRHHKNLISYFFPLKDCSSCSCGKGFVHFYQFDVMTFLQVSLCLNLYSLADGFIKRTIIWGFLTVSCDIKCVHCEATFDTSICGTKIHIRWTLCPQTPYLGHRNYYLYAEHMEQ